MINSKDPPEDDQNKLGIIAALFKDKQIILIEELAGKLANNNLCNWIFCDNAIREKMERDFSDQ